MAQKSPSLQRAGFIIFSAGALLGILLILVSAWPDLEAVFYGFLQFTDEPLTSLRCPVMMTSEDRLPITIKLNNPFDEELVRTVEAQFSARLTVLDDRKVVTLQPGETQTVAWEVSQENVDLKNFILARVITYPASSLPITESTCGTFVLGLPIAGGPAIFYTALFLAIVGLGLGLWLWMKNCDMSEPAIVTQSLQMRFIAALIAIGMATSMFGLWVLGIVSLALILVTLSVYLMPRKN